MKILLLDIETSPNEAYVWGLWNQNVATSQIINTSKVLCWAAKWFHEKEIMFSSIYETSTKRMLTRIHKLLDEADVVVHYNGTRFDIPTLNKEFLIHDMKPPAPFKQVDLLKVARNRFRFVSNKLDFVAKALNLGQKVRHKGFELWVDCAHNDPEAWKKMKEYNIGDVKLLEMVYISVLPWIKNHPNHALYSNGPLVCPNCASLHYHKRGIAFAQLLKYQRYQCQDCGHWFRDNKCINKIGEHKFVSVN